MLHIDGFMTGIEIAIAGMLVVVITLFILSYAIDLADLILNRLTGRKAEPASAEKSPPVTAETSAETTDDIAAVCAAAIAAYNRDQGTACGQIKINKIRELD